MTAIDDAGDVPQGVITYRGVKFSPEQKQEFVEQFRVAARQGVPVRMRGMISSSLSPQRASGFAGHDPTEGVILEIIPSTGAYLEGVTGVAREYELLQKHGTIYQPVAVLEDVTVNGQKWTVIQLQELTLP